MLFAFLGVDVAEVPHFGSAFRFIYLYRDSWSQIIC